MHHYVLKPVLIAALILMVGACASLYRVTVSEMTGAHAPSTPISVRVSALGIAANALTSQVGLLGLLVSTGRKPGSPHGGGTDAANTGGGTLTDDWADGLGAALREKCPRGRISNLVILRENRKYKSISAEYVTVKALCLE